MNLHLGAVCDNKRKLLDILFVTNIALTGLRW